LEKDGRVDPDTVLFGAANPAALGSIPSGA